MGVSAKNTGPTSNVRWMLIVGRFLVVCTVVIFVLFLYRSAGYIAVTRSYGCIEDTVALVDQVNLSVDRENGLFVDEASEAADAAAGAAEVIESRGECLTGIVSYLASDLVEKQRAVDVTASAYLTEVGRVSENAAAGADTWDETDSLAVSYDRYQTAISAFESTLSEIESRFFLVVQ